MGIHGVNNVIGFDKNLDQHSYIDLVDENLLEPVEQIFRDQGPYSRTSYDIS